MSSKGVRTAEQKVVDWMHDWRAKGNSYVKAKYVENGTDLSLVQAGHVLSSMYAEDRLEMWSESANGGCNIYRIPAGFEVDG